MARSAETAIPFALLAVVAVIGLALAALSFATRRSFGGMMGGGMMGGVETDAGPGGVEWAILLASAILFVAAVVLFLRSRPAPATTAVGPAPIGPPAAAGPSRVVPADATLETVPEMALLKFLDEDERRMYLELRDHGGQMLQRDLVALGTFSKAKVTRVLDKLESKGIVVRERHGMTNRVRLVSRAGK